MFQSILEDEKTLLDRCRKDRVTLIHANRAGVSLVVRGFRYGWDHPVGTHEEQPTTGEWYLLTKDSIVKTREPFMRLNPAMTVIMHCFIDAYA